MRQNVSARLIRDCLHDAVSESRDKTAQSCQRRMGNKLRDPTFVYHVENAYEELKNYPDIMSISNGGPITEEERAKGAKSVKTIANIRYVVVFPLYKYFILFLKILFYCYARQVPQCPRAFEKTLCARRKFD